jgi:predicted DNA-binding transcriptional regulator AlpA
MSDLLTELEAAQLTRLKVKTLQSWRLLKRGPRFVKLGRRVLYPRAEIEAYIARNLVETEPERP